MGLNTQQLDIATHAITTARDHLSYLSSRELREYPEVEDIMSLAQEVGAFLKSDIGDRESKTFALDFAFSYHYERMEETSSASPKMTDIIETAKQVVGRLPTLLP